MWHTYDGENDDGCVVKSKQKNQWTGHFTGLLCTKHCQRSRAACKTPLND